MKFSRHIVLASILLLFASQALSGCGYSFRNAKNPLANLKIKKIYINTFSNHTYRPGLEYFFTKAMVQEFERYGAFEITNDSKDADAIVNGNIFGIVAAPISTSAKIDGNTTANIATSYQGSVSCAISLTDKLGREIFRGSFSGSKTFPTSLVIEGANNDIVRGANDTAPLIGDSEQRLAIRFLARQLMADAYQRLTDIF